jgi:hypothetical protein
MSIKTEKVDNYKVKKRIVPFGKIESTFAITTIESIYCDEDGTINSDQVYIPLDTRCVACKYVN